MGHWAIYRRRGTAPATPPAPPVPLLITAVTASGLDVVVDFDGPITYSGGGGLLGFDINGGGSTGGFQSGPAQLTLTPDQPFASSDPWSLSGSPPEISQPVDFPQAGTIA